ncbi:putative NBD/HSP70 family sugar kinase [Rhodopseudomonas julia]|uniref:NBD/HSP70 family sugar kinase n=1 Tax=Rhodopseudomonas julia TaxID=200617 RepID=A0ABU0C4L2_9BRAD|nr:ROK family transcriptional regulator [Rhodopseudomonas julia]MDQ0324894.1 putative NBD/HSP70 family sugar kinase [Rhodopseudomonas julia]
MRGFSQLSPTERRLLLEVFWARTSARSDLAGRLDFSKSKINAAITDLIGAGLITEIGPQPSSGGRRAEGLRVTLRDGLIAGVDIRATHMDVALLSPDMSVMARHCEPISVRGEPEPLFARLRDVIDLLLRQMGYERERIRMIGIGVPGPVDFESARLATPPLMPLWEGFSPRQALAADFDVPIFVDNDVNILALGTLWHLSRSADDFLVVKVATGIGCGIICRGQVYRGVDGAAGDVGHICIDPNGPVCHCGNVGCVEAMAAAPAIARAGATAARSGESPRLLELLQEHGALSPEDVGLASREGDPAANAIIRGAGADVGRMLATLVNFFNPSHVFICGGVAAIGPAFLASIRQSVYQRSLALSTRHLAIRPIPHPDDAGIVGAGVLGFLEAI